MKKKKALYVNAKVTLPHLRQDSFFILSALTQGNIVFSRKCKIIIDLKAWSDSRGDSLESCDWWKGGWKKKKKNFPNSTLTFNHLINRMTQISFPEQISGYIVVPVALNSEKKSPVYHVIYLKKHEIKDEGFENPEAGRVAYAVNLPVTTSIDHVKSFCQDLAGVIVEDFRPEAGNRAQIVLVDKVSCTRLLSKAKQIHKLDKEPLVWSGSDSTATGYKKYIAKGAQKFTDPETLLNSVNEFMKVYNDAEERERRSRRSKSGLVDEDGFTLVTSSARGSKASIAAQVAATQEQLKHEAEKRSKKKEMVDFYRFQIREKKKRATNDLLKKFNDDKAKILELRGKNRFKPY